MTLPRYCTECSDYSSFGHCGATADFLPLPDPSGVTRPPLWCPKREADDAVVSSDGRVHLPVLKPTPELVPQTDDEAEALVQTVLADMARREGAKPTLLDLERERGSRWAEYQYDHRLANCEACPLKSQRDTMVLAQRPEKPENFNGLMIIGESPSPTDVSQRRPLAGLDGQLLDQLLAMSGVNRSRSYITQTVLCRPEEGTKLSDVYEAVEACRPRLLSEIAYVKPRVVVGLGGAALDAITGIDQRTTKKAKLPCPVDTSRGYESPSCEGRGMKKRKAYACAKCKLIFRGVSAETIGDRKPTPPDMSPCEFATSTGVGCGAKEPPKKAPAWQPRAIVCLTCDGKKQQVVEIHSFKSAFSLGGNKPVAGAVFAPEKLASEAARGAFHPASYFIPTYHPYLLRRPPKTKGEKQIGGQFLASAAVLHLRKAVRLLTQEPNFKLDWVKFYDSEAADFRAWLEANPGPYSVDLETNAKEIDEVTVIKCAGIDSHVTSKTAVLVLAGLERSSALVTAFLELLANPTIGKVWQNGFSYDYPVMRRVYGVNDAPGYIGDVLVRHSAIYPDEPHNLQHIGFEYADAPAWKPTDKKRNPADAPVDDELLEYCATDVRMTTLSFKAMEADLDREKVRVVEEMDTRKMHMGLAMERAGLPIDRRAQLEVGARCRFEAEQALGFMRMYIDERGGVPIALLPEKREEHGALFNPDSSLQLQWALFDNIGPCKLRPMAFTDSGAPSAAEEGLVKYKDHPFVNALFEYRKSTKTVSTYIEGIVIGPDGRLHARWNPVGARSGRYSTSPNVQNWAKWLRAMIVAPAGRAFIGADFDQLELRILAAASGDKNLILRCKGADDKRKLEPEWDPHSYVASLALGPTFTSLDLNDPKHDKKNPRCACQTCRRKALRDGTKATVYGLNYGAGAEKILEQIITRALKSGGDLPPVDQNTVEITIDAYFSAFPDVKKFRDESLRFAERTGYLREAMFGRIRIFPLKEVPPTEASNFGIQALAASVMDWGAWNVHARIEQEVKGAAVIAQIHDALYAEASIEDAPRVAEIMNTELPCEVRVAGSSEWMPLTASAVIGPTLKDVG